MLRLFVGLALPEEVRLRLGGLSSGIPGAKWVKPDNLHLSLRFIGEVDGHVAEEINHALAAIRAPGFDLILNGIDTFGKKRQTRVLWAGVEPCEALERLQAKVETALQRASCEPEGRRFSPHITLARFKHPPSAGKLDGFLEHNGFFQADPIPVRGFVLYRSHLGRRGAHYEHLAEYRLDPTSGGLEETG